MKEPFMTSGQMISVTNVIARLNEVNRAVPTSLVVDITAVLRKSDGTVLGTLKRGDGHGDSYAYYPAAAVFEGYTAPDAPKGE
jgi:hypothetical protein